MVFGRITSAPEYNPILLKTSFFVSGYETPYISPAIYVIPIPKEEPEIRVASTSHRAWETIPPITRAHDELITPKPILTSVNSKNSISKCCSCSRGHKIGVDVPKCCSFGIAEDHLFEHFFDDLVFDTNSCICSLSTLAEVLPKLASQNPNTGSHSSSNIEE